ncbi:HET-domain-containing protein [Colletotrichum falcatum]|nr:HET-domain-containing protein [Colletotrichum falcatum]
MASSNSSSGSEWRRPSLTLFRRSITPATDLCKSCSEIDFDQFVSEPIQPRHGSAKTTTTMTSLFEIIKNSRSKKKQLDKSDGGTKCRFCTLLFNTISLPQHDPFEHPAVKDHMPDDFRGTTFEAWAKGISWSDRLTNTPHPFGQGRGNVAIAQDDLDPESITETRQKELDAIEQAGLLAGAGAAGAAIQAGLQEKDRDRRTFLLALGNAGSVLTTALSLLDHRLPVSVTVKMHNVTDDDAGLLDVTVVGYGSKVQAPLTVLSKFNLRVASDYKTDGLSLRYGRIMGDKVNVEQDCRRWINHCLEVHKELCGKPDWAAKLPLPSGDHFRLIDLEEGRIASFKVRSEQDLPEYAALSYVWGDAGKTALNLCRKNLPQLERGVDGLRPTDGQRLHGEQKRLARTISDAVEVTRRLGIRYLWVDSLCVVQKARREEREPAQEEQIRQMDSIFGHAVIVIVAAGGEDADAGLAGVSAARDPGQTAREVRPGVNVLLPVRHDESYGKWDTRAWTLQEKLLSRRMLVFDGDRVSFHCRHEILREDMPAAHARNGPPPIPRLSMPPNRGEPRVREAWNGTPVLLRSPFFNEYAKLLEQYTSRDVTDSGDTLAGMLGLLRVLESMRASASPLKTDTPGRGDHTLHGLPEEFLDLALLWQPPAVMGTYLTERTDDVHPSWSWAGWEVGKDPSHGREAGRGHRAHPGVRFEEPFWVSGNDDMSLRKFTATGGDAEDRFRPLVMWYKWAGERQRRPPVPAKGDHLRPAPLVNAGAAAASGPDTTARSRSRAGLVPVNDCGMGYVSGALDFDARALERALELRGLSFEEAGPPPVPADIPLDHRHLVCETQAARFRLRRKGPRRETLWKLVDGVAVADKVLEMPEAEMLDERDGVVGYVIPTDQRKSISTHPYDFVLLSESQYWGNEKRIDVSGFPLYNVMLVRWDSRGEFAVRVGLGKVSKPAWKAAGPERRRVILK